MKYEVEFSEYARKQLKKMDRYVVSLIVGWIEKNLQGCSDPRSLGKALKGNKSGLWRYRIGDYRAICEIHDKKVIIFVLDIGHRRSIYK